MSDPLARAEQADAEALLRAALERLVLLECQRAVAASDGPSVTEATRLEHELRRLRERAESAESQRDRLFSRVLEAERLRASLDGEAGQTEPLDLASFIAELRSELADAKTARDLSDRRNAELAGQLKEARAPLGPRRALDWARDLEAQGLLFDGRSRLGELWPELIAGTATERLVLAAAVRDLDTGDRTLRESAVARLATLPPPLAAPVVAAALGRERDALLLERLLRLSGQLGVASLLPLAAAELDHADERVRAAALAASARLDRGGFELASRCEDPSPRVRRGAALAAALSRPEQALAVLQKLSEDPEPSVRQLVAAAAAALPALPEALLRRLGNDEDARVRRTALRALRAGPELESLPAAERRQKLKAEPPPVGRPPRSAPEPAVEPQIDPLPDMERELRSALRGCTEDELSRALSLSKPQLEPALARGLAEGRLVRRGQKLYVG